MTANAICFLCKFISVTSSSKWVFVILWWIIITGSLQLPVLLFNCYIYSPQILETYIKYNISISQRPGFVGTLIENALFCIVFFSKILLPSPSLGDRRYCDARHHAVTLCVCPPSRLYHLSTAHRISLGGEGNALYPVLSSCHFVYCGENHVVG